MTKGGGTLGRSLLIPFSFMPKKQKSLQKKGFSFGAEKGIRPAILGQYRRQPGELKNHSPDGFLPRLARPFPSHPFLFYAQKAKTPSKEGIFLWRRERDSSGDTGAVSPPARGTKKPFTGWFFASPCSAVPFSSLSLLCQKKQKPLQKKGFFLWRRERDSSGDTGAVSPPARGTKKPFTGWFFASPCSAVPFSSLSLLCQKKQKPLQKKGFFLWRRERDSNPCYGSP